MPMQGGSAGQWSAEEGVARRVAGWLPGSQAGAAHLTQVVSISGPRWRAWHFTIKKVDFALRNETRVLAQRVFHHGESRFSSRNRRDKLLI
jgi:hypothetical protein